MAFEILAFAMVILVLGGFTLHLALGVLGIISSRQMVSVIGRVRKWAATHGISGTAMNHSSDPSEHYERQPLIGRWTLLYFYLDIYERSATPWMLRMVALFYAAVGLVGIVVVGWAWISMVV